jgi:CHAT domain-containing protein/tetratricopeptide (TPR) repeat protein
VSADGGDEILRLAEADPRRTIVLAKAITEQANARRDFVTESVAERAFGIAAVHLDDLDAAVRHLRSAIRLANRAGSAEHAAEARIRLAFALSIRGRPQQGMREIAAALPYLHGPSRARAAAQRAAIFNLLGQFDDALLGYRTAVPALRRAGDQLWLQRVLSNRAIAHGYRHQFTAAEADLQEAEGLCQELDLDLSLAIVHGTMGWIRAVQGDVPSALRYFDLAESRYRALKTHQLGWLLNDRSELLLSVYLVSEAQEAAEEAVAELERMNRRIAVPEVRLLVAQAAALAGEPGRALDQADQARREFNRQQRPRWAARARFVVLRSRLAGEDRPQVAVGQLEKAADDLSAGGWPRAALEARLLAGQLALERGRTSRGREQLQQASRARHRGPVLIRARAWYCEALVRRTDGNRRSAKIAINTAVRLLDEHRAGMGAADLRAYASGHRGEATTLGLRMALEDGHAPSVLEWAERGRATHLSLPAVRPPDDPKLARALVELRAVVAEIGERRRTDRASAGLVRRQIMLERDIRDQRRHQRSEGTFQSTAPVPAAALSAALGEAALVEFVHLDDQLHAVTVIDGRIQLRRLQPLDHIRDLIERVPFALHRLARNRADAANRAAALAMLRHAAQRLDEILFGPLASRLGDRALVVIPTGPLQSLAWSVLPICRDRAVTVSPSAALWFAGSGPRGAAGHVVVAAGPGLPGAQSEAEDVAAIYKTTALAGAPASVQAVTDALDGADVAHLAAHGQLHPHNPLFSSLRFADGPLTVYDLEHLHRSPQLVVLAACDAGRSIVPSGDELLGLSAAFIAQGTRQIVAPVTTIPDVQASGFMVAFHRALAAGIPAAAALAQAQRELAGQDAATMAAAAAFVCIGGEYTLSLDGSRGQTAARAR